MAKKPSNSEYRDGISRTGVARARRYGARAPRSLGRNLRSVLKTPSQCSPHNSFRPSYRNDYRRELNVMGVEEQVGRSFLIIFKNWKLFLPLIVIGVVTLVLTVGVAGVFNETAGVFGTVVFLVLWLVTIYLVRQIMAKHKVTLRDGLYNAMTPMISTFVVFVVAVVECIPIFVFIIAYSAALETGFLAMPFYALLFWGFAGLMFTISGYLLSSSIISLIAVTAPGLYPFRAMVMAAELVRGRRMRFILRLIALVMVLAVIWAALVLPFSALKVPAEVLSVIVMTVACFSVIYMAVYLYIYYRDMLKA